MTLVKTLQPPTVCLAENPVVFGFTSDDQYAHPGQRAEFYLELTGYPPVGSTFELSWNNVTWPFTFVAQPGTDPGELPASYSGVGFSTFILYLIHLVDELKKHHRLSMDFIMELSGLPATPMIRFVAVHPGAAYTITLGATPTAPVVTYPGMNVTGEDPQLREEFRVYLQCFIEGELAGEDLLCVNEQGKVQYNVSAYLKAYGAPSFSWPYSGLLMNRTGLVKRFWVRYAERWGYPPAILKLGSTASYMTMALPGGAGFLQNAIWEHQNDSFWTELQYSKMFLSWAPKTRTVKPDQVEKLFFLNYIAQGSYRLKLELTFYDDTANPQSFLFSPVSSARWDVIEVTFSFNDLVETLPPPVGRVWQFRVWLVDAAGSAVSEKRTYLLDHRQELHSHQFIWRNSLGMYDTELFPGAMQKAVALEKQIFSMTNRYQFSLKEPSTQVLGSTQVEMFSASSGWIEDKEHADWLRELLVSKEVYELIQGVLHPIVITSGEVNLLTEGKTLFNIHFDYTRAYTDEHFSKTGRMSATFVQSFNSGFVSNNPYNPTI